jgi:hypothetical protein
MQASRPVSHGLSRAMQHAQDIYLKGARAVLLGWLAHLNFQGILFHALNFEVSA